VVGSEAVDGGDVARVQVHVVRDDVVAAAALRGRRDVDGDAAVGAHAEVGGGAAREQRCVLAAGKECRAEAARLGEPAWADLVDAAGESVQAPLLDPVSDLRA
jgi:hypothetical protein